MAEIALLSRPALPFAPLGHAGGVLRIEPLPEGRLLHALAPAEAAEDAAASLAALFGDAPHALRPYAPGQWFLVGDAPLRPGDLARMGERLDTCAALSDQSHGRVRLALEGEGARRLLAKGTALDLGDRAFPVGASAQTLFGHIGVHITRTAPDRYELIVLRSFAASLWHDLCHAGAEFLSDEGDGRDVAARRHHASGQ
ncbi:sarcosine oxidase subunit gamma [Aureimonas endophytica]|uniref:Sarcosine oxidase subunit gamma n=1 Tax=Aureimonas endophytica TaxID=2027858 RepID=A0A916ZMV7_9HYPH|nr:sarcosine oxidase subunit gamma family protein [Aureimonas endophytica]GGE05491.1 sarcosine oxidase subunit gamma [Aureimonas endophytica]